MIRLLLMVVLTCAPTRTTLAQDYSESAVYLYVDENGAPILGYRIESVTEGGNNFRTCDDQLMRVDPVDLHFISGGCNRPALSSPVAVGPPDIDTQTGPEMSLIGSRVVASNGAGVGTIEDVVVDADTGSVRQLVIAVGDFLGVGEKLVAVDIADIEWRTNENIVLFATPAEVEALPEFTYSD
ncbi:PRC-barrel domain-containing protein [Inquilinus sp. CAU 1745]|uniref:PRC-barrel domain-containing protein n=1 Tax=Inquilinus sp. CAU 1745 TaxID=3140369 RepID=UPI00325B2054